jgi:hypothetical protein
MRRLAVCAPTLLAASAALAVAGCGSQAPTMPSVCTDTDAAGYARALAGAPGAVRLAGGVAISRCLRTVRQSADLQNLGAVLLTVAGDLATRARDRGDDDAVLQLGYLAGAVNAGAARSSGVSAELANRITNATRSVDALSVASSARLQRGNLAGRARG